MAVDRPTFSESWYRVVALRPRLRSAVQITRQHYRGETWYVIQDPANNQFYRLNPAAYHFVGMLDGRRTVGAVWRVCNEQLGDEAPTQGESIQLLGQLYAANLIQADLPPDAESMFRRFRQRKVREVRSYLTNLLFIRIPVLDPDTFLNRWVGLFGKVFSPAGAVVWAIMIAVGLYHIVGRFDDLIAQGQAVRLLSVANLPWLYVAMAILKGFHEFAHAFACKRFGQKEGTAGEVHVMGIMFLVFTPLPYVDASSAWALRSKWRRVVVGMAGMFVELFFAAIAAVVWVRVAPGTIPHTIAYNMMFIASVSSLLFNGNPLLRYDGYYVLSDIVEIPNLWNRSRQYLYYLVKKYVWNVRRPYCPSQAPGEKAWLVGYAIASTIYRAFIVVAILMFVARALPLLGVVLATVAGAAWLLVPIGKFAHYLLANPELMRVRGRAVATTAGALVAATVAIGVVPAPDHLRAEAVVRPTRQSVIFARSDGFLASFRPSGSLVRPGEDGDDGELLRCENRPLGFTLDSVRATMRGVEVQRRQAESKGDAAEAENFAEQLKVLAKQEARVQEMIDRLVVRALYRGQWLAPRLDQARGGFIHQGDAVGMLVDPENMLIETVITQRQAAQAFVDVDDRVEMRLPGQPERTFAGTVVEKIQAGQTMLSSPALGIPGGGEIPVSPSGSGLETSERFFKVIIRPDAPAPDLRGGQRVAVRFALPSKPLAAQWYRAIRQLLHTRFRI